MVDVNKLTGIFRNLDRYLTILRELAQLPKTDLLSASSQFVGAIPRGRPCGQAQGRAPTPDY